MRGKEEQLPELVLLDRITPAYAGKSQILHLRQRRNRDHPRLCGEKR